MDSANFVSSGSVATLGAAAVAVVAVSNSLKRVFGFRPLRTAFLTSLGIAALRVAILAPDQWIEWVLALVNGCILFCTAMGMNEGTVAKQRKRKKGFAPPTNLGDNQTRFFSSWLA
jgi:hypothetical protein